MSTGTKIVQGALQKIGVHSANKPANPTTLDNGLDTLNSLNAALLDDDIILGIAPLEAIGEELGEPWGTTTHLMNILAIWLQPDHENSNISAQLRINASNSMAFLKRKYKVTEIPSQVIRDTMPRGAGNHRRDYWDSIFFDKGDTIGD